MQKALIRDRMFGVTSTNRDRSYMSEKEFRVRLRLVARKLARLTGVSQAAMLSALAGLATNEAMMLVEEQKQAAA